jgi:hypothetical protein
MEKNTSKTITCTELWTNWFDFLKASRARRGNTINCVQEWGTDLY